MLFILLPVHLARLADERPRAVYHLPRGTQQSTNDGPPFSLTELPTDDQPPPGRACRGTLNSDGQRVYNEAQPQ